MIDGHPYCVDCAAELEPHTVRERVIADHVKWNDGTWKSKLGGPGDPWRER